jgi:prepilin-type N-terminal cleavage/methylation domain-containing protein
MQKKFKSFTLIELLVVIAIIGILSGLIVVSLNRATASAQDARTRAGVDSIRKTILAYGIHSGGVYPTEACIISSTTCPNLTSALVPDYYSALPNTNYSYTSTTGTDFTVSGTLSNSDTYSYSSLTGFSETSPSVERITNGGFETGDVTGWTVSGSSNINSAAYLVHTGTYSLSCYYGAVSQNIDLTDVDEITFWAQWIGDDSTNPNVIKIDGTTVLTISDYLTWTKYTINTSSYSGVHTLTIDANSNSDGWFDDFSALATP